MNVAQLGSESIAKFGQYDSLYFQGRVYTNVEVDAKSRKLANGLKKLGVKAGDRVGILLNNCPEALFSFTACFYLGAWAMPILFSLVPDEIGYILEDSQAEVLITQKLWLSKVVAARSKAPNLKHILLIDGEESSEHVSLPSLMGESSPDIEISAIGDDEVAVLIYTSGTTGKPKGTMLTHKNLYTNIISSGECLRFERDEVTLLALPLNHAYGIVTGFAGMAFGMKSVLMSWFKPDEALKLIERFHANGTAMVPTMLIQMLKLPNLDRYDTSSMRRWVCAAAPLKLDVLQSFEKTFKGRVLEAYGLTEAGPGVTVNRMHMPFKPGSVGLPYPGVQVSIQDDIERVLKPNERGEICVRGPNVMKGYYKKQRETDEVVRNGWLHTGDAGYIDEDGYLFLTARLKDLIIRGGENIYPVDIERVLLGHPDVADVSVVAMHDDEYGEDVMAVIVPRPGSGVSEEAILEFCETRLAKFQRPKKIVFSSMLPKNPVGKVIKKNLRKQFGGFGEDGQK